MGLHAITIKCVTTKLEVGRYWFYEIKKMELHNKLFSVRGFFAHYIFEIATSLLKLIDPSHHS